MKRLMLIPLLLLAALVFTDDGYPPLGPRGILKYYPGPFDGTKLMDFGYILNYSKDYSVDFLYNEVKAKYGKPFRDLRLREYFLATDWYAANPAYHDGLLSDIDRENLRRIEAVQTKAADASGLLADLSAGRSVSYGEELNAFFDGKKYVFVIHGKKRVTFTPEIVYCGGFDRASQVYFFNYQGMVNIGILLRMEAYRGYHYVYCVISFQYDSRTKKISDFYGTFSEEYFDES